MTRTARYKLVYFGILTSAALLFAVMAFLPRHGLSAFIMSWVAVIILLLMPGRIQGFFWADLQAGLYHLNRQNYATSKACSERFLLKLDKQPWLRKLIWLGTSSYSRNVEVLARNNLGAAMMKLGEIDGAKEQLSRAIALDPECPLPCRNMGVLLLHTGPSAQAMPWFEKAEALGLKDDVSDAIVQASQHRHAAWSTRDKSVTEPPIKAFAQRPSGPFVVEIFDNDDTPFEFVVVCLEETFGLTGIQAIQIASAVDLDGSAPCAAFETEDDAQAKADELQHLAIRGGFPLSCAVRREEGGPVRGA